MKYSTFPAKWLLWTACITLVLASCNIEINLPASASSDSQPGNSYSSAAEREQQDNAPSSSSESSQPASSEVRVDFWADDTNLNAGECTVLHWNTSGGTAYINGGQHPPSGEYEICPEKTTKYKLELENPPNNLLDKEEFTVQVNQTNGVNTPAPTDDDPVVVAPQDPSPADI
ncbi:MAG: hypothetical protein PVJ21_23310, partial [Anaerolineales bacterium]